MKTDYLIKVLEKVYKEIDNKGMFMPVVLANTIISYKLTFYDTSYWMEFCHWVTDPWIEINDFDDIKIFFDWFVRQTPQFELLYNDTYHRLIWFEEFFIDFSIKQKYYFKNPDILEKHMLLFSEIKWDSKLIELSKEVLHIAWSIKFKK